MYAFACQMLGSPSDARDVAQEVLITFWRKGEQVDSEKVLPWLMRVTRNACIDALRRRKMVRGVMDDGADVDGVAHESITPADRLERDDERRMIESALESLSEPYRSIVILREIQHLKYDEICGAMDLPMNTVKVYLHRGRKMLREKLTEVIESERV